MRNLFLPTWLLTIRTICFRKPGFHFTSLQTVITVQLLQHSLQQPQNNMADKIEHQHARDKHFTFHVNSADPTYRFPNQPWSPLFTVFLLGDQQEKDATEKKARQCSCYSFGQPPNGVPSSWCGRQVVEPSSLPAVVAHTCIQANKPNLTHELNFSRNEMHLRYRYWNSLNEKGFKFFPIFWDVFSSNLSSDWTFDFKTLNYKTTT